MAVSPTSGTGLQHHKMILERNLKQKSWKMVSSTTYSKNRMKFLQYLLFRPKHKVSGGGFLPKQI